MKPEYFSDEDLAGCSFGARLLGIALLQLCDSQGVFRNVPIQLQAHAFPWDTTVNVPALLGELEGCGYLKTYRVKGKHYGVIPGFRTHQRLTGKEAQSDGLFPGPDEADQEVDDGKQGGKSQCFPEKRRDAQEGEGEGEREQGKGTGSLAPGGAVTSFPVAAQVREVFQHWQQTLQHPQAKLTEDRKRKVQARLREGFTVEQLKAAIDGCARSPFHMGENDQGQKHDDLELICRKGSQVEKFANMPAGGQRDEARRRHRPRSGAELIAADTERVFGPGGEAWESNS